MNATNQIFSWPRFTATLRKEFIENWRSLLLVAVGIYLWYTISMLISNVMTLEGSYNINPLVFTAVAAIMASFAFRRLTTRCGRVVLFTSPSSTAEKYIANLLIYVLGAFVIFTLSFQLADVTRYVAMSFFNAKLGIEATLPNNLVGSIKTMYSFTGPGKLINLAIAVELLLAGSIFFLGSVLWPRRSVIKMGTVVLLVTLAKLILLAVCIYTKFGENLDMLPENMIDNFMDKATTINLWIDCIIYVGSLILAWFTIKRKDVITLKWWK